jgi:hypothetical protein
MKKLWAIACTVAFAAFWIFGLMAVSGLFGERAFDWTSVGFSAVGLGVGLYARAQVNALTRNLKQGLHVRPQQGQDAYAEQVHS